MKTFVFQTWISKRLLLTFLIPLLLWLPGYAVAETKTVCDAGCDYTSIREADFNTRTGDTIFVRTAKVYNESDLSLGAKTLVSDGGPESFIINGSGCNNHVLSTGGNGVVEGFTITGCVKTDGGNGAGIVSNGNTELNNVIIEGNSTTGGSAGLWHNGGGMLTIRNSVIRNNTSVSTPAMSSVAPYLRIFNLKVTGNTATGPANAGSVGIMRQLSSFSVHIDGLEVTDNAANGSNISGGALFVSCSGGARKVGIFNSTISNNVLTGTNSARGGGLYVASCSTDLVATTISGNTLVNTGSADSQGGGVYSSTTTSMRLHAGSTITGNTADSGGGVWCANGKFQIGGTLAGNNQADTDFVDGNGFCTSPAEIGTSKPESGTSGDPVNTFTGELFDYLEPDLELGGPNAIEFSRFYNSSLETQGYRGALGRNWLHTFEYFLAFESDDILQILTPTGGLIKFYRDIDNLWVRIDPTQIHYQLVESSGNFVLYDPETKYQYTFDRTSHRLLTISDANNNALTLTYTGADLTSVEDGLGRTLTLTYDTGLLQTVTGGSKVISFTQNTSQELLTYVDALGKATAYAYKSSPDGLLVTATRPEANIPWVHSWDTSSRISTQTDALGNRYQYSYADGETTITDPADNTTTHRHDGAGVLREVTDEAGQMTLITPDDSGNRQGVTDQLGNGLVVSYDPSSGNVSSILDSADHTFNYAYTSRMLANGIVEYDLTRAGYADGSFELWQHDTRGNVVNYTDLAGEVSTYTYDSMGNVLTATNPVGGVTTSTYLADGSLNTVEDPAGNLVDYGYDAERRRSRTNYSDGRSRQSTFDLSNQLLTFSDENGALLSRTFDGNTNLIASSAAASVGVDYSYDEMDRVTSIIPAVGSAISIAYDAHGRIKAMTGPNGNTMTWVYDSLGRITSLTDSVGIVWSGTYDAAGRLLTVADALDQTTSFVYDDADRPIQITDAVGTVQQFEYDGLDRVISASTGGRTTVFGYDARGIPETISVNNTLSSAISYNEFGRPAQLTDAKGGAWTFGYDVSGRTVSTNDPLSNTTFYGFDSRNRHNHTEFPDSLGTLDVTHDGRGQITALDYSDGTILNYGYDAAGSFTTANGLTLTRDALGRVLDSNGINNTRDATGRLDTTVLAGGTLDYSYDTRGQFTSVQDWLGGETALAYDAAGRLTTLTHANGLVTGYTYNAVNEVATIEVKEGATVISRLEFTRDAVGQITSASRTQPIGTPLLRPRSSSMTATFDNAMQHEAFAYDALGRRTVDDRHAYTWSLASRLTQYSGDSGATTVSLQYDGLGNIISRSEGEGTRTYSWNHATDTPCIAEMTGATIRHNVCGPDGRLLYSITTDNERWYYHYDEMGNVHFVTDDNGEVLAVYRYSPFGTLLGDSSNGGLDNPFTYQGRTGVVTEGNGLYLFQSRVYDSQSATFLSRDPITGFDPATANPYQYALNNPMLFIDPDGGQSIKAEDIISGGIGFFAIAVDELAGAVTGKLDRIASVVGRSTGPGKALLNNSKNINKQSGRLGKVGVAAWAYSAYQEIDSTNDKVKRTRSREEKQLRALLSAYDGNVNSVNELYKQKKISYRRWRAWLAVIDNQFQNGVDSTVSLARLEIAQDSVEGLLKAVGSVALPANVIDAVMGWLGRNVPASDRLSNSLTEWSAN